MSHDVDMFDRTIRHQQAIFMLKILFILRRALNGLFHRGRVLRMNPLEDQVDGGCRGSVVLEDSKGFLRPNDLPGGRLPAETASVAETLRLGQVSLALAKRLLGALTFRLLCGFTQRTLNRRDKPR